MRVAPPKKTGPGTDSSDIGALGGKDGKGSHDKAHVQCWTCYGYGQYGRERPKGAKNEGKSEGEGLGKDGSSKGKGKGKKEGKGKGAGKPFYDAGWTSEGWHEDGWGGHGADWGADGWSAEWQG